MLRLGSCDIHRNRQTYKEYLKGPSLLGGGSKFKNEISKVESEKPESKCFTIEFLPEFQHHLEMPHQLQKSSIDYRCAALIEMQQWLQRCSVNDCRDETAEISAAPAAEMQHHLQRCSTSCRDAGPATEITHQLQRCNISCRDQGFQ